jgi:hypothetical protein
MPISKKSPSRPQRIVRILATPRRTCNNNKYRTQETRFMDAVLSYLVSFFMFVGGILLIVSAVIPPVVLVVGSISLVVPLGRSIAMRNSSRSVVSRQLRKATVGILFIVLIALLFFTADRLSHLMLLSHVFVLFGTTWYTASRLTPRIETPWPHCRDLDQLLGFVSSCVLLSYPLSKLLHLPS